MLAWANRRPVIEVPYYPKGFFKTSFGPVIEYLVIPANKRAPSLVPPMPDRDVTTDLFFNAIMLRVSEWASQLPRVTNGHGSGIQHHNLVLFNNLGHGKSELNGTRPEEYLRLCGQAAHELLLYLDVARINVVAHSIGAPISFEFHEFYSKAGGAIDKMALISPLLAPPSVVSPLAKALKPRINQIRGLLSDEQFSGNVEVIIETLSSPAFMWLWHKCYVYMLNTGSKISYKDFSDMLNKALELDAKVFVTAFDAMEMKAGEAAEKLARIPAKVLAVLGEKDFITDPAITSSILSSLRPDAKVITLPGCAHWAPSEHPHAVKSLLSEFLQ